MKPIDNCSVCTKYHSCGRSNGPDDWCREFKSKVRRGVLWAILLFGAFVLLLFWLSGCDYSAYNSKTYPDGSQWTGVGTISFLSVKDRTLKDMVLRDGSRLGEAATKIDPDEKAIKAMTTGLFDLVEKWMLIQPNILTTDLAD